MAQFNRMKRCGWAALALGMVGLWGQPAPVLAAGNLDIPWKQEIFTKQVFEEDVKVILRELLERNGLDVIFRPGVEGLVTVNFEDQPLQSAFQRLMETYELDYSLNAETNTVSIFQKKSSAEQMEFITPQYAEPEDVISALKRFRIVDDEVTLITDPATRSILVKGPSTKLSQVRKIADQVDDAEKNRQERARMQRTSDLENSSLEAALKPTVKVIPLRYASVDTSTVAFQGEEVSVPGIIDSLQAFVGNVTVKKTGENGKEETVKSVDINRPVISIDKRTNSVIVQGTAEQVAEIEKVVAQLDQPVPLVETEVLIVQGSKDLTKQLGVDWTSRGTFGDKAQGNINNIRGSAAEPITGSTLGSAQSNTGLVGSTMSSAAGSLGAGFLWQGTHAALTTQLSALTTQNKAQTIASPNVVTLNNTEAKITTTQNFYYVTSDPADTNSGTSIQSVSVPTELTITPSVIPQEAAGTRRLVRMRINAKTANPSASGVGANATVNTNEQELLTEVIIPEQATYILGGLFNSSRQEDDNGVPGLKDIPFLGHLFDYRRSSDVKDETLFLITPRIFESEQIAGDQGGRVREYVQEEKYLLTNERESLYRDSGLLDLHVDIAEDE